MSNNGKGSAPRPFSVDKETFASNWDRIFMDNEEENLEFWPFPEKNPEKPLNTWPWPTSKE